MPQSTIAVSQMPLLPIGLSSTNNANAKGAMIPNGVREEGRGLEEVLREKMVAG